MQENLNRIHRAQANHTHRHHSKLNKQAFENIDQYTELLSQLHFNMKSTEPQRTLGVAWGGGPYPDTKMLNHRHNLHKELQEIAMKAAAGATSKTLTPYQNSRRTSNKHTTH